MIVSFLWKIVAMSLWEEWTTLSVDADLVYCYQIGLALGFVLLTTLCLLTPSTKEMEDELKKKITRTNHQESTSENGNASRNEGEENKASQRNHQHQERPTLDGQLSAGTASQKAAVAAGATVTTTTHQQLNFIIYIVIITVILVILDRDYNGGILFWLAQYFPREAALIRGRQ